MTDTYNDTTGSRKKFLIPLVVLLLCAVSLTGAGYAYNASVTVNNADAPVDEYFTVNIFEQDGTVIKNAINPTEDVDGLVFVTSKVMNSTASPAMTLKGVFDKEKRDIVIYTGAIKVVADELSRDTNPYSTPVDDETSTVNAVLSSGVADTDCKAKVVLGTNHQTVVATLTGVTVKFYSDAACTQENNKATINDNDFVYYQVIATGIADGATEISAETYDPDVPKTYDPAAFAADVVTNYEVLFDFKIVATAEELDA